MNMIHQDNTAPFGKYQGHCIPLTKECKELAERKLMFDEEKLCNPNLVHRLDQDRKENARHYYYSNKDEVNGMNKFRNKQRVKCECGNVISYATYFKTSHKKSKSHKAWEEQQKKNNTAL